MKLQIDLSAINITSKKELKEFLLSINYTGSVMENRGDIAGIGLVANASKGHIEWALLDIVKDLFEPIIGLRSVDPDLRTRFRDIAAFFSDKAAEIDHNYELMKRSEEADVKG